MAPESQPVITVEPASPLPAYRQIADQLRAYLVSERLQPGERLPTVRQLAMDLALNHNTVAEAYRLLAEEGFLELAGRRGAIVRERRTTRANAELGRSFSRRLEALWAEALSSGVPAKTVRAALLELARRTT